MKSFIAALFTLATLTAQANTISVADTIELLNTLDSNLPNNCQLSGPEISANGNSYTYILTKNNRSSSFTFNQDQRALTKLTNQHSTTIGTGDYQFVIKLNAQNDVTYIKMNGVACSGTSYNTNTY